MRQGPEDRQAHLLRHVRGVAQLLIGAVAQHRREHARAEAAQEGQQDQERGGVDERLPWFHGGVEDADVGKAARFGQACFLGSLLDVGVELLRVDNVPFQAQLINGERRELAQVPRRRLDVACQLRLPRRNLSDEPASERGNRAPLQRRHLACDAPHFGIDIGVAVLERSQVGALPHELLQHVGQLRRARYRADQGERVQRQAGVRDLRQHPFDAAAVVTQLFECHSHLEKVREHRVAAHPGEVRGLGGAQPPWAARLRGESLGRHEGSAWEQGGRADLERPQRRLGAPQVRLGVAQLVRDDARQLAEPLALEIARHGDKPRGDGVHHGGDVTGVRPPQRELQEVAVGIDLHLELLRQLRGRVVGR